MTSGKLITSTNLNIKEVNSRDEGVKNLLIGGSSGTVGALATVTIPLCFGDCLGVLCAQVGSESLSLCVLFCEVGHCHGQQKSASESTFFCFVCMMKYW